MLPENPMVELVLSYFPNYINLKICKEKNGYLLTDLYKDSINICEDHAIPPIFGHIKSLRRYLENNVTGITFAKSGKYVVVCSSEIDPVMYSNSTLKGHGLRKNDIMRSFAKMIQRISKDYLDQPHIKWPSTVADIIAGLDKDKPIAELFNVIYMTMNTKWKSSVPLNKYGFAKVNSKNIARKIWSLACDWTSLITDIKNAKQIALGLYVHRLTASKEVGLALWKSGHAISPNDVRKQNEEFLCASDDMEGVFSGLIKEAFTHSSLDNNDKCQDTSTGKNTTHHTNFLIFQNNTKDLVEKSFKKNILWSLAGGLPDIKNDLPLLGSWTAFMKNTCREQTARSLIRYLPANENPPEHGVCKEYLDYILDVMKVLEIKSVFVHADEQVYARIVQLIWKYKDRFQNVIPLMGGFHQLRVFQRVLYKQHGVYGYQAWYADAGVIAEGSAEQAFKGGNYYRSMRI